MRRAEPRDAVWRTRGCQVVTSSENDQRLMGGLAITCAQTPLILTSTRPSQAFLERRGFLGNRGLLDPTESAAHNDDDDDFTFRRMRLV